MDDSTFGDMAPHHLTEIQRSNSENGHQVESNNINNDSQRRSTSDAQAP